MRYTKEGLVRFIGHLDTTRVLTRAFARSSIPALYSEGFSPHMKVSFGPSLPLGFTSEAELVDVWINDAEAQNTVEEWKAEIQSYLPEGMDVVELSYVEEGAESLSKAIDRASYEISVPGDFSPSSDKLACFLRDETVNVERETKSGLRTVNVRPGVERFNSVDTGVERSRISLFELVTVIGGEVSTSPALIMKAILGRSWETVPEVRIHRDGLYSSAGKL